MQSDFDKQWAKEGEIICWCIVLVLTGGIIYGMWRLGIEIIALTLLLL